MSKVKTNVPIYLSSYTNALGLCRGSLLVPQYSYLTCGTHHVTPSAAWFLWVLFPRSQDDLRFCSAHRSDGRNEVASGFTKNDLKALEADDLQLIIELLRIKSSSIIKLHGNPGLAMSAKTNIGECSNLYSVCMCRMTLNIPPFLSI